MRDHNSPLALITGMVRLSDGVRWLHEKVNHYLFMTALTLTTFLMLWMHFIFIILNEHHCLSPALPSCSAGQKLSNLQLQIWQWEKALDLWILHWESHPHPILAQVSLTLCKTPWSALLQKGPVYTSTNIVQPVQDFFFFLPLQRNQWSYQCWKSGADSDWGFSS